VGAAPTRGCSEKEIAMRRMIGLAVIFLLFGGVPGLPARSSAAAAVQGCAEHSLLGVERKSLSFDTFRLESGRVLPQVTLAYETYGQLAADGRNAILIAHGYTSHHHAAGCYTAADPAPGWWDALIGPGKAIDTARFFVVASNMLGSSYGSTGPASLNPATGKPYGPEFPDITLGDIVRAQRELLARLGVTQLVAVAGPSFGGYQAFQWAVTFPDFMQGIVAVATAPRGSGGEAAVARLQQRLAADPNWHDGWYDERGGIVPTLTALRIDTLKRYGLDAVLAARYPDPEAREAHIRAQAEAWARQFDAHSLLVLRRAAVRFDAERDFARIRAKVLYVLSRTDRLFPPTIAPAVMERLRAAGVEATYAEIDSDFGHLASGRDAEKWAPALRAFLERLSPARP
jgi:homoserine O-acetyltransferase